jgi:hypothetical protein
MANLVTRASQSLHRRWTHAQSNARIRRLNRDVAKCAADHQNTLRADARPVVFFNASTRLAGLSLNAAYSLISRWAVGMAGVPVVNFVCDSGMAHCVLGTNRDDPHALPPCAACTGQSRALYAHSQARPFQYHANPALQKAIEGLSVPDLETFQFEAMPLGALSLPSMRWVLRRHHLIDNAATRYLYGQYILSAWRIGLEFARLLEESQPQAVVVFNGMFYPEATAAWVAHQHGLRVVSHEVGLRPYTAYFTTGDATAYPIHIPEHFKLSAAQNRRLDDYLEKRMQGNFTMAGVRFWPEMRGLDRSFLDRAAQFHQVVAVFTNVIFDTSQPHSNVVFPHMFAWLDLIVDLAHTHPGTLFVIRAHPDEARPGKESRESVADWVRMQDVCALPNVMFVESQQYFSSYELIQRSKFVMVYNSTIGLEAALMGAPVLCGGRARFTQLPTVFFPSSPEDFQRQANEFLAAEKIVVPAVFKANARRFLYYQLYRTSLPFDAFLEDDGIWQGYVRIKDLEFSAFDPQNSSAKGSRVLQIIVDGILNGQEFLFDEQPYET